MDGTITLSQIEIMPYQLIHLHELKVVKTANDHARLIFAGTVDENLRDYYMKASDEETQVKVFVKDGEGGRHALFRGIALDVKVKTVNGINYMTVEAISHTRQLDMKRRKRSFQNPRLTYTELIKSIVAEYGKEADVLDVASGGKAIGTFVMQYDETDWEFLKRLASHFYSPLIPAVGYGVPKLYFGMPMGLSKGELQVHNYKAVKRVSAYQTAAENRIPGVRNEDFLQYEVEADKLMEPGHEVLFQGRPWLVAEAVSELRQGLLKHSYKLSPRSGLRPIKMFNRAIIGASIHGKVLAVRKDKVQVKLDMDEQVDPATDFWFPYSTIYASEGQTGWYCMPEVGDQLRIYFPSYKEEEGYAISSVKRTNPASAPLKSQTSAAAAAPGKAAAASASEPHSSDNGEDVMADPAVKTLQTKYGKKIVLAPDKIVISSGGMSIIVSDSEGITIKSDKDIGITAGGELVLSSQMLQLSADKIELSGKGSTLSLEEEILLSGSEIKMN
ncbi:hypothetical protein GNQ08_04065 [Paenibacillus macerans]|uniref:Gp5/Type VI secretion system Vgr protein OB-fold domain-containing protein n=1 Tax=Paenibacillus macerans TaxID=44252 RepID=A0A6N8ES83_PAEMA|nr:phage baseplate assembly protein V [Paenibacillus macerans]MBS5914946.1 hypothetical protein [Paenibacillus macerans]MDU5946998.1 contractile injection system protein, VgrG/Pvc8 family [Paenibacillus macerans]MUG21603.1 hypothetical protein [Paenibacillus macerans]GIP10614.1 hypothetical protein J1TS5_27840 [Paenibacillus macerans]